MEVAHLFAKDIVDHSVQACQKLCQEVGRSFHAVKFTPDGVAGGQWCLGSPPPYCVPTSDVDATEGGGAAERISLLSHQLSMMEMNAAHDAVTRLQLQEKIATLEENNERLGQEARQQREDADYHRDFFYRLLEAADQLNSTVADIHQDYTRTVNINMFPKNEFSLF
jgi:hypothetical protein